MIKDIIVQACAEHKKVFIHYKKENEELSERVIGNIIPSEKYGEGYIDAFCYKRNDNRTFKIDRIMDARIIDEHDFVPTKLSAAPLINIVPQPHTDISMPTITNNQAMIPDMNYADPKLKQLCKYYLNCLALENTNSISVPKLIDEKNPQYIEISTPYISGVNREEIVGFITSNTRQRKAALVGYPVMVANDKIIPLLLFQVTADYGIVDMSITPFVNKAIIDFYVSDADEQMQELLFLEEQLGMNNDNVIVDVKSAASSLRALRSNWIWKEEPNPDIIQVEESISFIDTDGIYNRCILLQADLGNYTMGLEMELNSLSKMNKESYKDTALYQWLYGEVEHADVSSIQKEELLEVLSLNTEQVEAICHALHAPLTIVTGPPGTGKSQVVADLIVNLAHKGKNAIFSSKNNKAVDVVEQRTNELGERPIMLRLGGRRDFTQIAEFLRKLLYVPQPSTDLQQEFNSAKRQYEALLSEKLDVLKQQQETIDACNYLTRVEKQISRIKDKWVGWKDVCSNTNERNFTHQLEGLKKNWIASQKERQPFWTKLIWMFVKKERIQNFENSLVTYNTMLRGIKRQELESALFDEYVLLEQEMTLKEYHQLCVYKAKLEKYKESPSFENLDKKLTDIKFRLSATAKKLWSKWLAIGAPQIPDRDRRLIASFLANIELNKGDIANNQLTYDYKVIERLLARLMPICAVTSLSARGRLPFAAGCYDLVIIDEASQCDIASIIPLLFRAKRAVIIGDPNQLKHITTMTHQQDRELVAKHDIDALWSYSIHSLFDLAVAIGHGNDLVHLRDHHRSHANIIEYSNREFYNGLLRVATDYSKLRFPFGIDKSVLWKDITGKTVRPQVGSAFNQEEIDAVIKQLNELVNDNYSGTIGVVTPFKRQAEKIADELRKRNLYDKLVRNHDFIVATAHKFQGDERDVIIFSPVVSNEAPQCTLNFLGSTPNLFNVAITRARASLIVFGNKAYCQNSNIHYLAHFADYTDSLYANSGISNNVMPQLGRNYPDVDTNEFVSEWEKELYTALYDKGIKAHPQFAIDKYHIDLALFVDNYKLAIEVGEDEEYNSEQSYTIHLKNSRLIEMGWDVIRFIPYQIKDDLEWCVETIQSRITKS
jgi:very-short-patch-repair endonuclease